MIGENIRARRLALGLTQGELGALLDPPAPRQQILAWEKGISEPRTTTAVKLARALGCSLYTLVMQ